MPWKPVEAHGWLRELSKQLPKGEAIKASVWPGVDTMSAQAKLYWGGDTGTRGRVAEVELGIANDQFTVKKVTLAQKVY